MVPKSLDDLICDFNYIASPMQTVEDKMIDIPLFYTKQVSLYIYINSVGQRALHISIR